MQYLLISLTLLAIGCQTNPKSLGDYRDVKTIFSANEIESLEKIIGFFNESICKSENLNNANVIACYKQYFIRMRKAEAKGTLEINIPFQEQEKLIKESGVNSFNQMWGFGKPGFKDTDTIEVIHDGIFVKFLEEFGKENNKVKNYVESLKANGDITPTMVADILINYKEYDVRDERIKLFIAIHYLTLNELIENQKLINAAHNNDGR